MPAAGYRRAGGEPRLILDHLFGAERATPAKAAVIRDEVVLSYQALADRVRSSAAGMVAMGVRPGDRVALAAASTPEFVAAYLGVQLAGGVVVPVAPRALPELVGQICTLAEPTLVVGLPTSMGSTVSYGDLLAAPGTAVPATPPAGIGPESPADLLFTTGSTGRPKGVLLSHRAIETAARHISEFLGQNGDDVEVLPLPLAHSFGLGRVRCCLYRGSTLVLVEGTSVFADAMRAIRRHGATGYSSVPSGYSALFQSQGDVLGEFSGQLRYLEIGSAPMSLEHKQRLMRLLPDTRICMHYGLTEASRSAFIEFHESRDRLDSIGRPSPGVEIQIVDERGVPLPAGVEGQIAIRSDATMIGYWKAEDETRRCLVDGLLVSGDRGHCDADGYLYLSGRQMELINVGGRKVAPAEIEAILGQYPAIADCACVGMPDPAGITGQVVKALVVARDAAARPTNQDLARHLRGRIEPYKMPRAFEWVDAIPRSESGKILRKRLR
jgi:long-chain acyl-CoA synthetase